MSANPSNVRQMGAGSDENAHLLILYASMNYHLLTALVREFATMRLMLESAPPAQGT